MTVDATQTQASYAKYWVAWLCLLVITLVMVFVANPLGLMTGMALKATIIVLWFMHLRYERLELTLSVIITLFATSLILFFLMVPDGRAM